MKMFLKELLLLILSKVNKKRWLIRDILRGMGKLLVLIITNRIGTRMAT